MVLQALVYALYHGGQLEEGTSANIGCAVLALLMHCQSETADQLAAAVANVVDEAFCCTVSPFWEEFLASDDVASLLPSDVKMVRCCMSVKPCRTVASRVP